VLWNEFDFRAPATVEGGVLVRRFDATGQPPGKAFRVVPPGGTRPRIGLEGFGAALGDDGTPAVAWTTEPFPERVGRMSLRVRLFAASTGAPRGPARLVMQAPARFGVHFVPAALAVDETGRALLVTQVFDFPHLAVEARAFAANGAPDGGAFPLASEATADHAEIACAAAAAAGHAWLVAWRGDGGSPIVTSRIWLRAFQR
jgi:hypothetical protein